MTAHTPSPVRFLPAHGNSAEVESPAPSAAPSSPLRPLWFHGITIPAEHHEHRSLTLDAATEARALALIAEGVPCRFVAHRLGCAFVTVAEVAFRHGVTPRGGA